MWTTHPPARSLLCGTRDRRASERLVDVVVATGEVMDIPHGRLHFLVTDQSFDGVGGHARFRQPCTVAVAQGVEAVVFLYLFSTNPLRRREDLIEDAKAFRVSHEKTSQLLWKGGSNAWQAGPDSGQIGKNCTHLCTQYKTKTPQVLD